MPSNRNIRDLIEKVASGSSPVEEVVDMFMSTAAGKSSGIRDIYQDYGPQFGNDYSPANYKEIGIGGQGLDKPVHSVTSADDLPIHLGDIVWAPTSDGYEKGQVTDISPEQLKVVELESGMSLGLFPPSQLYVNNPEHHTVDGMELPMDQFPYDLELS